MRFWDWSQSPKNYVVGPIPQIRSNLNWKNPKNFIFWPKFSRPPPPLRKGPYRRKRRYFVPNSNYKVFFVISTPPLFHQKAKPHRFLQSRWPLNTLECNHDWSLIMVDLILESNFQFRESCDQLWMNVQCGENF